MNYEFKVEVANNYFDLIVGWRPKTFSEYEYKKIKKTDLTQDGNKYYTTIKFSITKKQVDTDKYEYNNTACFSQGLKIDVYSFQVGTDSSIYGWLDTSSADKELKSNIEGEHNNRDKCVALGTNNTINAKKTDILKAPHGIGIYLGNIDKIIIERTKSAEYPLDDTLTFNLTIKSSGNTSIGVNAKETTKTVSFSKIDGSEKVSGSTTKCLYLATNIGLKDYVGTISVSGITDNDSLKCTFAKISPKKLFDKNNKYSSVLKYTGSDEISIVREHSNKSEFGVFDYKWISLNDDLTNISTTSSNIDDYGNYYGISSYPNESSASGYLYPCSHSSSSELRLRTSSNKNNFINQVQPTAVVYIDENYYNIKIVNDQTQYTISEILLPNQNTSFRQFVLGSYDFIKIEPF